MIMRMTYKKGIALSLGIFMALSLIAGGIAFATNLQPTLNILDVLEDPSKLELSSMSISNRDNDSVTWKIELQVDNDGSQTLLFPRLNFQIKLFGYHLGDGWIADDVKIGPYSVGIVPAYMKMDRDNELYLLIHGLLQGSALSLVLDGEAVILIDGLANSLPLAGLSYPFEMPMALSEGDSPSVPKIWQVNRSAVQASQPVNITISASDSGIGINRSILSYSNDTGVTWTNITMSGIPAEIISSNWMNFTLNGTIPASINTLGSNILFKFYVIDDFDNIVLTDNYSYTVPTGPPLAASTINYEYEAASSFLGDFLDYLGTAGIDLNYLLKNVMPNTSSNFLTYRLGQLFLGAGFTSAKSQIFLEQFLANQTYAFSILSDAGLSIGSMLESIDTNLTGFTDGLIDTIALPTADNFSVILNSFTAEHNSTFNNTLVSIFGENCSGLANFLDKNFTDLTNGKIVEAQYIPSAGTPILDGVYNLLTKGNSTNGCIAAVIQYLYFVNGTYEEFVAGMGVSILDVPSATTEFTFQIYQSVMFGVLIYFALILVSIAAVRSKEQKIVKSVKKKDVESWFKRSTIKR